MKEKEVYGIDLMIRENYEKLMRTDIIDKVMKLKGFILITSYGYTQSMAALFDSEKHRKNAFNQLVKNGLRCEIISGNGSIPA